MPYTSTPPGLCSASKMVTLWPLTAMSKAMMRPAGPLPTTAMRQPVLAARFGSATWSVSRSKSAANRSRAPIASRFSLVAQQAELLALVVLRADAPADRRQRVLLADEPGRAGEVARGHQLHEPRDVDLDRAAVDARGLLALKTPARLSRRQLAVVAVADLLEVADAQARVLLRLLLPRRAGEDLGTGPLRDAVPGAVRLRAARQRSDARAQGDVDGEDARLALVAEALPPRASDAWQCGHMTSVATASPVQQGEQTRSNSSSLGLTSRSQHTVSTSTLRPTHTRFVWSS